MFKVTFLFNKMKIKKSNLQRGQTIIEAVVALMTILAIMTAISIVIVNGLYNSRFIKNQNEANKYAQQGMELVRNIQKNDLKTFSNLDPNQTYCLDENNELTTANCSTSTANTNGTYNRTISFSPGSGTQCEDLNPLTSEVKVTVTVKWSTSKCPANNTFCHQSQLQSCLSSSLPASNP